MFPFGREHKTVITLTTCTALQHVRDTYNHIETRGCSYDPTYVYREVFPNETNISVCSYGVFHPACRDEIPI
jgi:hypothetical protein